MAPCIVCNHTSQIAELLQLFYFFSVYCDLYCFVPSLACPHNLCFLYVYFHVIYSWSISCLTDPLSIEGLLGCLPSSLDHRQISMPSPFSHPHLFPPLYIIPLIL